MGPDVPISDLIARFNRIKEGPADRETDRGDCEGHVDECSRIFHRIKVRLGKGEVGRIKKYS